MFICIIIFIISLSIHYIAFDTFSHYLPPSAAIYYFLDIAMPLFTPFLPLIHIFRAFIHEMTPPWLREATIIFYVAIMPSY